MVHLGQARASDPLLSTIVLNGMGRYWGDVKRGNVMKNEPLISTSQRGYLRAEFSILADACPFDQGNPHDCPFHEVRNKSPQEILAWFDALTEEAILNIHTYCLLCLEVRKKLGGAI